ncbi:PEGA domain-containing protein [Flavobacterium franklandianum]|uniref:PEGA domain-containing protein n=1 Tax=Flavobacterium franklandianum TaxID=2594430 RepID=A0A553C6U1_9FLAO|nr:PEGA domain-containing protein [Flavobacterium franklandianum]TRX16225.1 PEGA domain-containing protein [Flavobacterium franklandianum]
MKKTIFAYLLSSSLLLSSCATIISGSKQNVKFASNPSSATIFIDEVEVGKTPFELKLARNSEHDVQVKLDGYQTYQTSLTKKFNAWYLGNILIGGIIGLIVDPITGAIYNLSPNEINAKLNEGTVFNSTSKGIYIAVVLNIDPTWKKVGQLEKVVN